MMYDDKVLGKYADAINAFIQCIFNGIVSDILCICIDIVVLFV